MEDVKHQWIMPVSRADEYPEAPSTGQIQSVGDLPYTGCQQDHYSLVARLPTSVGPAFVLLFSDNL